MSMLVEEPNEPDAPPRPFWQALIYERDGSLNLSWPILSVFTLLSIIAVVVCLLSKNAIANVAALSFLAITLNLFALGAFSQNKAKIVAQAKNIGDAGRAVAGVFGGRGVFGPSTEHFDDADFSYSRDRDRDRAAPDE